MCLRWFTITTKQSSDNTVVSVTMSQTQVSALDDLASKLSDSYGGITVSRAAAARLCIDKGLSILSGVPNGIWIADLLT